MLRPAVLADRDVNLLFAGVCLNVSSGLASAGQGIASAASDLGGANGNYALAPAALAGYQTYNALTGVNTDALKNMRGLADWAGLQKSGLGSVSLTVGYNASRSAWDGDVEYCTFALRIGQLNSASVGRQHGADDIEADASTTLLTASGEKRRKDKIPVPDWNTYAIVLNCNRDCLITRLDISCSLR